MTSAPTSTIHKSDADTGAPVPGTVFLVKGADGHSVAEVTTGPDGSATVENLLPGVYEVSEKSVPSPTSRMQPSTGHALPEPEPGCVF